VTTVHQFIQWVFELLINATAVASGAPWWGNGCTLFIHQPKVPDKLRKKE